MPERARTAAARLPARSGFVAAIYRSRAAIVLAAIACAPAVACGSDASQPRIRIIDLIRRFGDAEKRPISGTFELDQHTLGATMRASIAVPVPSRIIWTTPLPHNGTLNVLAGVAASISPSIVRFRIGVSDHRIYEALSERTLTAGPSADSGWSAVAVDLSAYAGTKLSIFYRPDRLVWRLILSVDAVRGTDARGFWGEPGIDTDLRSARHFFHDRLARR